MFGSLTTRPILFRSILRPCKGIKQPLRRSCARTIATKSYFEPDPSLTAIDTTTTLCQVASNHFNNAICAFQWGLEQLHAASGLPWWLTIVLGTGMVRICLIPVKLRAVRNQQRMHKVLTELHQRLGALKTQLLWDSRRGKLDKDIDSMLRTRKAEEWIALSKKYNVNPIISLFPIAIYLPVFLVFSATLRKMCAVPWPFMNQSPSTHPYPQPQDAIADGLSEEGILWFSNLAIPDLPLTSLLILLNSLFIELSFRHINPISASSRWGRILRITLHVCNLASFIILCRLPSVTLLP